MNRLKGAMVMTNGIGTSGRSENIYGVGSFSLDARRTDGRYIDIGELWFANPNPDQLKAAEEAATKYSSSSPTRSEHEAGKAHGDIQRRLSLKQANYLMHIITRALNEALPDGVIPHDDDIPVL